MCWMCWMCGMCGMQWMFYKSNYACRIVMSVKQKQLRVSDACDSNTIATLRYFTSLYITCGTRFLNDSMIFELFDS